MPGQFWPRPVFVEAQNLLLDGCQDAVVSPNTIDTHHIIRLSKAQGIFGNRKEKTGAWKRNQMV
ncbi:MAG: hypothetical protein WAK17_13630 [Candidatus Nitrosopolaris sp.]